VTPESAEELFEDAPCGYLSCELDGTIARANRTFERWTGHGRETLVGRRFRDLLTPAGQIYHETHYAPLLRMQGWVREIALEVVHADGTRLPALVNAIVHRDAAGEPASLRITVFDASDRRRYEQELLEARRREQDIARQLQRSLLAGAIPAAPELEIGLTYRPAVRGLEVGGDWYDAFWLDGERAVGLVVGDVVGRGIEAAATMGQLRSAVRALAATGLGPGPLLAALDGYAARHDVGRMTTVAYAQLDLAAGELRYACAGHPPPIMLEPGAEPEFLWEGRSAPLDAAAVALTGAARPEAARTVAPGGAVFLYTDGLIERRSRPLHDGLDRLLAEIAGRREAGIHEVVTDVARALAEPHNADDVCLLGARRAPFRLGMQQA
jgi:PAS domain S-box-containing protein